MANTGEAPPKRGAFSRLQVFKGQGFYWLKYIRGLGKLSLRSVKGPKRANKSIMAVWLRKRKENFLDE